MNIDLTWDNPTPHPDCGFKASYRRKGDSVYSTITTSGSTSATTSLHLTTTYPANYEGFIQSDCCSTNLSTSDPWGVNAYSIITIANPIISGAFFKATVTSLYPNPYDTVITGTVTSNQQGSLVYSATYPAGSTSALVILTGIAPTGSNLETVSNLTEISLTPIFNNGGMLQQYDPVNTPSYFEFAFVSGFTSGTTFWTGAPNILPSFTLDTFTPTSTDGGGNVISGNLLVSWAQGYVFGGGSYPYNIVKLVVQDQVNNVMGVISVDATIKGLRSATIPIVKQAFPIDTVTSMKLIATWADDTLTGGVSIFYLPDF